MKAKLWLGCLVAASGLFLAGRAATNPPQSAAKSDPNEAQITVLYDAFGKTSNMQKDWGFSALIEYGGTRILFDTGNNADIFAHNVITPVHCTGEPAFAILKQTFGDRYLYAGLGTVLALGPTVKSTAEAGQSQAMDEDDLRGYRMLLAQSDDSPEKILAHSEHDSYRWLAHRAH